MLLIGWFRNRDQKKEIVEPCCISKLFAPERYSEMTSASAQFRCDDVLTRYASSTPTIGSDEAVHLWRRAYI